MRSLAAILLAFAVIAAQVLHGGLWNPVLVLLPYALLVAAGLAAIGATWRGRMPVAPGALMVMTLAFGYFLWRAWQGPDPLLARLEAGQILAFAMAFAVAGFGLGQGQARWVLLALLGAAALVQAGIGFYQLAQAASAPPFGWFAENVRQAYDGRFPTRARGTYLNPNHFAWFMNWAALMAAALVCWGRGPVILRIVTGYVGLVCIGAAILSGSRGGALGLAAGLLVIVLAGALASAAVLRRGRRGVLVLAAAVLVGGGGLAYGVYASNWVAQARVDALQQGTDVRALLFEHGVRLSQEAPLLGGGPGAFLYGARLYRSGFQPIDAVFAHNDWLQTLVEYGWIGFALWVIAAAVLWGGGLMRFLAAVRRRAEVEEQPRSDVAAVLLGALAATTAFAVHGLFDFNLHVPANALLAGLTLGLLAASLPVEETRVSQRIRLTALKFGGTVALLALVAGLGVYLGRYARTDRDTWRAENAVFRGDPLRAMKVLEPALARSPEDARVLALQARALMEIDGLIGLPGNPLPPAEQTTRARMGRFEKAAAVYDRLLTVQPRERENWSWAAMAHYQLRQYPVSDRMAVQAIALDPAQQQPYAVYGDMLDERGDLRRALAVFHLAAPMPYAGYAWQREQDLREKIHDREAQ